MHSFDNTLLVSLSQIFQGVASFLIGPSHLLSFILPDKWGIIMGGLILTGLANTFTTIATYQEMYEPFMQRYGPLSPLHSEKLSDILSGLYNAGFSLGVILGPFAGDYLTLFFGYRLQADIMGFFGVGYGILHMVVVYLPSLVEKRRQKKQQSQNSNYK